MKAKRTVGYGRHPFCSACAKDEYDEDRVMRVFLIDLLIGVIGGIYSGVIVSRVFLLREELEEQLDVLRKKLYYFEILIAYFEITERIKKLQSDQSREIGEEIRRNSEYLNTHDIIHASDVFALLKKEMLDKAVDEICFEESPLTLKNKFFIQLVDETKKAVGKYKEYTQVRFETIDNAKEEILGFKKKYEKCLRQGKRYLFDQIIRDKVVIVLFLLLIVLVGIIAFM